jgi:glycerol kinase
MAQGSLLGIDAGTTGVTVVRYDRDLRPERRVSAEVAQHYPRPGWVEHDAAEIVATTLRLAREAAAGATIAAVGLTNQRETIVALDPGGRPLARAIVWQCRRTTDACARLRAEGRADAIARKTGLVLDPYFSATKARWLLDHDPAVAAAAARGALRFATIDALLAHALTGRLVTDPTNASRTMLYDLERRAWDPELLALFGVRAEMLPEVVPSAGVLGETDAARVGFRAPLAGIAGDQQAALFGHGCVEPGSAKCTYGTGSFLLMNAGARRPAAAPGLLATLACGPRGEPVFALEGAVFVAGAAVQWLRDALGIIRDAGETEALAASLEDNGGVYLVPAFVGLGAPHWAPEARGLVCGLTRGAGRAHLARAALESIAYQVHDLFRLFVDSSGLPVAELDVDGGAARNDWLMRFQAGLLGLPVARGADLEATSRGAAALAAVGAGLLRDPREAAALSEGKTRFESALDPALRERWLSGWRDAVARALPRA